MAAIDRYKKAFKRLMATHQTATATLRRDNAADIALPVIEITQTDIENTGEFKKQKTIKFYKITGDDDLVGVSELIVGDDLLIGGRTFRFSGDVIEENPASITANFNVYQMPFRANE